MTMDIPKAVWDRLVAEVDFLAARLAVVAESLAVVEREGAGK